MGWPSESHHLQYAMLMGVGGVLTSTLVVLFLLMPVARTHDVAVCEIRHIQHNETFALHECRFTNVGQTAVVDGNDWCVPSWHSGFTPRSPAQIPTVSACHRL